LVNHGPTTFPDSRNACSSANDPLRPQSFDTGPFSYPPAYPRPRATAKSRASSLAALNRLVLDPQASARPRDNLPATLRPRRSHPTARRPRWTAAATRAHRPPSPSSRLQRRESTLTSKPIGLREAAREEAALPLAVLGGLQRREHPGLQAHRAP
jgi:hypothetical protein